MDIGRILTRSLEIVWRYKFLWLFGFVLGLTSAGAGGNGNFNFRGNGVGATPFNLNGELAPLVVIIAVVVGLVLALIWLVLFFYFRFVSRGALVSAVQDIETQGSSTLREAWNQGRTFYARLLGLGFLVNVPLALFTLLLILIAFVPFVGLIISAVSQRESPNALMAGLGITGVVALCCAILCLVLVHLVVHPLYEFAVRAIVLENLSVREGIKRGIEQARAHLGNVIVVYLILMGARLGWAVVSAIIIVPLALVFAALVFGMMRADLNGVILVILAAIIPFWLVIGVLEGIFQTFESNVWTEAYIALDQQTASA